MNRTSLSRIKVSITLLSYLALLLSLAVVPVGAQLITSDKIRTYTMNLDGWNMESDQFHYHWVQLPAQIVNTQILNVQVLVFSDEVKPEVFNLTRQSGKTDHTYKGKSGGKSNFYFKNNGQLFIQLDRGPCAQDVNGNCLTGVGNHSGFFAVGNHSSPANSFPKRPTRTFYDASKSRVSVKIEYYCTSCPATTTNKFWKKVGAWNMALSPRSFLESDFGISPQSIVDLNATIYSDPNSANKIQVDNFEHLGARYGQPLKWRGRGGMLWFGYGMNSSNYRLNLAQGPVTTAPDAGEVVSSYRSTKMIVDPPENPDGTWPPSVEKELKYQNAPSSSNRGWVLVEYTGAKSAIPNPYIFLTRALPIGAWNMLEKTFVSLPLSQFGVSASRIGRIATSIQADPSACLPGCEPGIEVNNFHRTMQASGHLPHGAYNDVGGITYIDESEGTSGSVVLSEFGAFANLGFYNTTNWYSTYTGAGNRGHVLIDYLAGSCEQGPAGFKIQAIPDNQVGDCAGNASTFTLEGAGDDIWGSADEFAFVHNAGSGDIDIRVKIESQAALHQWAKAGIMIRDGLGKGARHASILVTPNIAGNTNGAHFTWRSSTGGLTDLRPNNTSGSPFNSIQAPYYLRLVKQGTTFTAYARSTSSSSWTTIWSQPINGFPPTYYYGLAQSSHDKNLAKAVFSEFTTSPVSGSTYRIINVHSGKALDVANWSISNGGNIHQWPYGGGSNQKWQAVQNGQGYWKLINQNSGKVLDVSGGPSAIGDGANVHQWTDLNVTNLNATNQQWQVTDLGVGIYRVTARHSGKALDVSGVSTADGANVHQWTYGNGNNQKWRFMSP